MKSSTVQLIIVLVGMLLIGAGLAIWRVEAGLGVPFSLESSITSEDMDKAGFEHPITCEANETLTLKEGDLVCVTDSSYVARSHSLSIPKAKLEVVSEMETEWTNTYEGGAFFNRYDFVSEEGSLTITTNEAGGWHGAKFRSSTDDWSNSAIHLYVKFEDWEKLDTFLLLISTDEGNFEDYFTFNFRKFFNSPESEEWIELVLNKSDFEVGAGEPDWSKASDIIFRLSSKEGESTSVTIDQLAVIEQAQDAIVSLAFDGGYSDVLTAKEILDQYDFTATSYLSPLTIGVAGYLSQDQIDSLHVAGWDISGWYSDDLRETEKNPKNVLEAIREYLVTNEYNGSDNLAYPNGGYTRVLQQNVENYFVSARTSDGLYQSLHYIDPYKLQAKVVWEDTDPERVIGWINRAIQEQIWLVLVWHKVADQPSGDLEYSAAEFSKIVSHLKQTGVIVQTISEVLEPRFVEESIK